MNANRLTRLYDGLDPWERIPLLIAADAKGDVAEWQRLFDASPIRAFRFGEHAMAEMSLHTLALMYITEQLDAAATYFFAVWQMGHDDDPRTIDWPLAADASAYFFTANLDAWRRFCSELDVSPEVLTTGNHPRGWILGFCEERMPANAPTVEALQERLRAAGQELLRPVTAESLLASWRNLLRMMTRCTPREAGRAAEVSRQGK